MLSAGLASVVSLVACSGSTGMALESEGGPPTRVGAGDGGGDDAGNGTSGLEAGLADVALDRMADSPLATLTACPASLIQTPGSCYAVLPTAAGASAGGENSGNPSIALSPDPAATARGQLVLFFNGSGGKPTDDIASPTVNFYDTAASLGYAVLAVSYLSNETIAKQCTPSGASAPSDACYFPSRETVIRGVYQPGAASDLAGIVVDEGIAGRTLLTLEYLAANDPGGGWGAFFTRGAPGASPESQIAWEKVVTAGHSQGGGHAAAIGKLFPVARVAQLSSTCDALDYTTPATWTAGATAPWASDPAQFWGLGTKTVFTNGAPSGGDTTCFAHLAVWTNLGMVASHQNDGAIVCSKVTSDHGASIGCPDNAPAWKAMLQ
jgi:hypothetical protein